MKKLILFALLAFSFCASAQYTPTGTKTRFSNGIGLGTKLDAYFGTADSVALYARADSSLMFKYKGTARALAYASQLSDYVTIAGTQTITGAKTFSAILTTGSRVNINGAADSANYALNVRGGTKSSIFTVEGRNDRIYEVVDSAFTRTGLFGYVRSSGEIGVRMANSITNNSITLADNGNAYYNSDRLVIATITPFANRRIPFSNNNGLLKDTSNFNIDASGLLTIPLSITIPSTATVATITNTNTSANQATFSGWERNQGASSAAGQISVGSLTTLQGQVRYASSSNTRTTLANSFDDISAEVALETRSQGTAIYPLIASGNGVKVATLGTGTVYSNSGTLTNTNPSDRTLKNTVKPLGYGLAEILKLKPKTFYYNSDSTKSALKYGFIAQDVHSIMPDVVREFSVFKKVNGKNVEDKKLGLESDGIYVTLVKAIQEQQDIIDQLRLRIAALENK